MNYSVALTIPASTTEANIEIEQIRLPRGVVKQVAILFPDGCCGLAHIVIYEYEHQLWPTHLERSYAGSGVLIVFPCDYDLPKEWNLFSVRGWNDDTVNEHTPIVFITVLSAQPPPTDLAEEYPSLVQFIDALRGY